MCHYPAFAPGGPAPSMGATPRWWNGNDDPVCIINVYGQWHRAIPRHAPGDDRRGAGDAVEDVPLALRRAPHGEVRLAIAIVVRGHRDIPRHAPGGDRRGAGGAVERIPGPRRRAPHGEVLLAKGRRRRRVPHSPARHDTQPYGHQQNQACIRASNISRHTATSSLPMFVSSLGRSEKAAARVCAPNTPRARRPALSRRGPVCARWLHGRQGRSLAISDEGRRIIKQYYSIVNMNFYY